MSDIITERNVELISLIELCSMTRFHIALGATERPYIGLYRTYFYI